MWRVTPDCALLPLTITVTSPLLASATAAFGPLALRGCVDPATASTATF